MEPECQIATVPVWRGQPNVAPSVHLEFCPGQQAYFSEKSTWMRACEFVMHRECSSPSHCSFPFLLLCYCLLSFLCSHVRGTGTEWIGYIAANCWLFNLQELCTVSWFRHFAKRTMSLHYIFLQSICIPVPYAEASTSTTYTVHHLSNRQQWHSHTRKSVIMVLASCRDILCVAVYCFSKLNVFLGQFSILVFANFG